MFTVAQIVVRVSGHGDSIIESLHRVTKVWKNGVVEIRPYDLSQAVNRLHTYSPDGWERSGRSPLYKSIIRPLADGETPEGLLAKWKAMSYARQNDTQAKAKAAARQNQINLWWNKKGLALWNSRVRIDQNFMGEEVSILQYNHNDELRMVFVVAKNVCRWGGDKEVELFVSGLYGREYTTGEGKREKTINSFASGSITGKTLAEALFDLVH